MRRRKNSDERGRRREREAHDGTPAGQASVLVERMRRGELDPNRLLIGALLGDPVARLALPGWHRTGRSVSNLEDARSSGDLQYFLALPLNALDVIEYGDVHQVKIDPDGADWWPEAWQIATALFVDVMGDTARSVLRQRWRDEILSRSVRVSDIHDLEFALRNAGAPPAAAQIRWTYYHALIDALYPWARGEGGRTNPPDWARYPRTYVSPRSRALTPAESRVRDVTVALKHGDPAAVEVAAHAMARFVPRGAILVPAPSSTPGTYSGADVLARRLAELTGGEARVLVGRTRPVESSRTRRRAGGKGLTPEEHAASMVLLEDPTRYARRPLVLVDNVVVSGATLEGMKRVLGRPDLAVVAYSGAEEVRRNPGGDRRLRDLERRARQGDLEAVARLAHEQQRRTHDRGLLLGVDDPRVRDVVQTYLWTTLDNWHDQHEYRAVNNWPNDMAMALAAHVVAQDWAAQGNAPASYLADVYAYDADHEATLDLLRGLTMADLLLVLEHVVPRSERERLLTGAGLLMSEHHANLLRRELGFLVDILWQVPR